MALSFGSVIFISYICYNKERGWYESNRRVDSDLPYIFLYTQKKSLQRYK